MHTPGTLHTMLTALVGESRTLDALSDRMADTGAPVTRQVPWKTATCGHFVALDYDGPCEHTVASPDGFGGFYELPCDGEALPR